MPGRKCRGQPAGCFEQSNNSSFCYLIAQNGFLLPSGLLDVLTPNEQKA